MHLKKDEEFLFPERSRQQKVSRLVFGFVSQLFLVSGAALILFVGYQLWGTGFETRSAQQELTEVFEKQLVEVEGEVGVGGVNSGGLVDALFGGIQVGDPVARLEIPKIGVDYIVSEGVDLDTLKSGPGHFPQTPLPGQPGNSAIAGHRSTYDEPFNLLNEMVPGDEIVVTTLQGVFRYEVLPHVGPEGDPSMYGYRIVEPTALEILDDKGDNRITLMGCHPRYGSSHRIVVEAKLVGVPAPTISTGAILTPGEGEKLLAGEPGSWTPVVVWFIIVFLLYGLMVWGARRCKKLRWGIYLVGIVPIVLALFSAFSAINALNPIAY